MAGYRARVRDLRDRVFAPSVHQTVAETSSEVSRALIPELQAIFPEFAEVRRILGDQGDAADEIAEITGRALARLTAEIADLHVELGELHTELGGLRSELGDLRSEVGDVLGDLRPGDGRLRLPPAAEDDVQLDRQ